MKRLFLFALTISLLASCGGGINAKKLGQEVCDCYRKANNMNAADPQRPTDQDACLKKQMDAWNKVKDHKEKTDEFNLVIGDCGKDMIEKSFGQ